jgi:hypothetical protein
MDESLWVGCVEPTPMLEFLQEVAGDRKLRLFACACCRRIWDLITTPCCRTAVEVAERYADGLVSEQDRFIAFAEAIREANGWANCCGAIDAAFSAGVSAAAFAVAEAETVENAGDAVTMAEAMFPDFIRVPTMIAALDASGGAGSAAAAWVQAEQERDVWDDEEHADWEHVVVSVGKNLATAMSISSVTSGTDYLEVARKVQEAEQEVQCDLLRDVFGNPFRPVAFDPSWRTSTVVSLAQQMYDSRDFSAIPILADAFQDAGCDNAAVLDHCRSSSEHVRGCWLVDLILGKK